MIHSSAYLPLCLEKLRPDQPVAFDLYMKFDNMFTLYATKGHTFSRKDLFNLTLSSSKVKRLYAKGSEQEYFQYVEANLPSIVTDERIDLQTKAVMTYTVATNIAKAILEDPRSGHVIKRSKQLVANIVKVILLNKAILFHLMQITSHDYYTYTHSVNVCTLAVALAKRMGIKSPDLNKIGLGALLHDLGKCHVDLSILEKAGPPNEDEWKIIHQHPTWGVDLVTSASGKAPESGDRFLVPESILQNNVPPEESLAIIEQHHESCDGRGYPLRLIDKEIHLYSKIVRVVDIYDAMTTNRSYRRALSPYRALQLIYKEMINGIDKKIFTEFILLLGYGTK